MHYIIYQIKNKVNGKIYIGKHKTENINDDYMGSGKYLKRAQDKYGIENFEKTILCECASEEEMNQKERELVNEEFIAREDTYNIILGGSGGWDYINENRLNITDHMFNVSEYCRKYKDEHGKSPYEEYMENLKNTDIETYKLICQKIGESLRKHFEEYGTWWTGQKHKESTKEKIREHHILNGTNKGNKNPNYGNMWICNDLTKENKVIKKTDSIPNGWRKGKIQKEWTEEQRKKYYERIKVNFKYISNGIEERPYKIGDEIPEGWELGGLEYYKKKHYKQQI